ncbi:MAG TPA: PAS domain-containing sensor histidine kinase [Polyangia bacterium]
MRPERSSERPFWVLAETMRAGAAMVGAEGTVMYANRAMAELVGLSLDEVIGASFRDLVAFEERLQFDGLFDRAADQVTEGESVLTREYRRVPVHLVLSPAETERDLLVCVVATDLSTQKRSVDVLASERLARTIVEQVPEILVVCDENGRIARVSDAIRKFTDQNLLLRPFAQAFPFPGVEDVLAAAVQGKATEGLSLAIEDDRPGRRMRYLLGNFAPLRDHDGCVVGCVVALTDVTSLKQTEAKLHEAVQARDDFLSIAAHELRTPLTSLQLQIDSLLKGYRSDQASNGKSDFGKKLATAARQTERLGSLIDALLDVSRLTGGQLALHDEELDLRDVVKDLVERNRQAATRAGCSLRLEAPARGIVGRWDRTRVEQVLLNLMSNAMKYGAGKPIDIKVEDCGDRVRLRVRDRGIGVAAEDAERIFHCFERAVPNESFGGLGLGLFISRQVVESYGGSITVEPAVAPGAAFLVELPKQRLAS